MSSFQETAKELIDKGSEFMSGLASTAGDVAAKARIKMKIADLVLEENKLMQQLGRDVYEQLADDTAFRAAHAELIARIEENAAHKQGAKHIRCILCDEKQPVQKVCKQQ